MQGDDDMEALMAEWGYASTPTPSAAQAAKDEKEQPQLLAISTTDDKESLKNQESSLTAGLAKTRLTENPRQWPSGLKLGPGLVHACPGWKKSKSSNSDDANNNGAYNCKNCKLPKACHRLSFKSEEDDDNSSNILSLLFLAVRNIRCICGEFNQHEDDQSVADLKSAIASHQDKITSKLGNNKQAGNRLSPTDLTSLRDKARDLTNAITRKHDDEDNNNPATKLLEWRLRVMMKADQLYYRIYYAALTSSNNSSSDDNADERIRIPHPPTYFSCPGLAWDSKGHDALAVFLPGLNEDTRRLLTQTWGLGDLSSSPSLSDNNPLYILWQSRFLETLRHFWCTGYAGMTTKRALATAQARPDHMIGEFAQHETLAMPVLQEWRDVARDFPASLYSYATPCPKAIETILKSSQADSNIVEVGAGTGYFASLIQRCGGFVKPYDLVPPGCNTDNDYHGEVPAFTVVHPGDASTADFSSCSSSQQTVLFCYPTPGTDMAASALRKFAASYPGKAKTVLHVGEWAGLTGDSEFERLLELEYECSESVPLPIWGTDAAYLTVWCQSRGIDAEKSVPVPATGGCSAAGCNKRAHRRCRFARCLAYCSAECFREHCNARESVLALHMLDVKAGGDVQFDNQRHFMEIAVVNDRKGGKGKRKRKKHRS